MPDTVKNAPVNGLDLDALGAVVESIQADPSNAKVGFEVVTRWTGQTRSESKVTGYTMAGERIERSHTIVADEPHELLGQDSAPNPQELLMSAFNACIMVGYVAGAAVRGVRLDSVEIETRGTLDLRGFLGLSDEISPGYEEVAYTVRIKGDGTPEDFAAIHEGVLKTSPNYFNMSKPIRMVGTLSAN